MMMRLHSLFGERKAADCGGGGKGSVWLLSLSQRRFC